MNALRRATFAAEDEGLIIEQADPRGEAAAPRPKRPPMAHKREKPKWQGKKAGKRG